VNGIEEDDIPKYKKKRQNQSKAGVKSRHKHQYEKCILHAKIKTSYLGQEEKWIRSLSDQEVYERYHMQYPIKEVRGQLTDQFVAIDVT